MKFPASLPLPPGPQSTKEGWGDQFESHLRGRIAPEIPSNWKRLPPAERERFDQLRVDHHNSFGPVLTPTLRKLNKDLCNLAVANLKSTSGARPGAVIDGLPNRGKSTNLTYFGYEYERLLREHYGTRMASEHGAEWHPVVYTTLTAKASVLSLNSALAYFYGAPVASGAAAHQLTKVVVEHAQKCATTLFLVDDINFLNLRHEGSREVINHLKQLANETSATFVYAGIGIKDTKLLTEGKPDDKIKYGQMRGRFAHFPINAFEAYSEEGKASWLRLVRAFEDELVLLKARQGMCTNLAEYLYKRTNGVVGSLSNLIRQGANSAIEDGTEKITKKLLNGIEIDAAAQDVVYQGTDGLT